MSAAGHQILAGQVPHALQQLIANFTPAQILAAMNQNTVSTAGSAQTATNTTGGNQLVAIQATALGAGNASSVGTQVNRSNRANRVTKPVDRNRPRVVPRNNMNIGRALNCFIAYRSYYAAMFLSIQQKDISGLLTFLWQNDPFKTKWALLAKAYTIIRSQQKTASLHKFLKINAPFVGVIPPSEYLEILGWAVSVSEDGHCSLIRRFTPDLASFDGDILGTDQTVNDLIQHSYKKGYIPVDGTSFWMLIPPVNPTNMMAVNPPATQAPPAVPVTQGITAVPVPNVNPVLFNTGNNTAPVTGQNTAVVQPAINHNAGTGQNPSSTQPAVHHATAVVTNTDAGATQSNTNQVASNSLNSAEGNGGAVNGTHDGENGLSDFEKNLLATLTAELEEMEKTEQEEKRRKEEDRKSVPGHELGAKFKAAGIAYPYDGHFNPNGSPDLTLNPYAGDKFDQYDISDFVHTELFEE